MKKVFSLIIGIVVISGIIALTSYTLTHKDIRNKGTIKEENTNTELVSSNFNGETLAEIYSVYLNGQRHKIKFEYNRVLNRETAISSVFLRVYFDGGNIITEDVVNNYIVSDIKTLFEDKDIKDIVKIDIDDIEIRKINEKEYVLLKVRYYDSREVEKYYLFDDRGDLLINNGTIIKDNRVRYVTMDNQKLDVFYGVNPEEQIMGKFENNIMYALELMKHEEDDMYEVIEYIYYFKDEEFVKEELKTYPNIKRLDLESSIINLDNKEDNNQE